VDKKVPTRDIGYAGFQLYRKMASVSINIQLKKADLVFRKSQWELPLQLQLMTTPL
jgi:hypothetical protein